MIKLKLKEYIDRHEISAPELGEKLNALAGINEKSIHLYLKCRDITYKSKLEKNVPSANQNNKRNWRVPSLEMIDLLLQALGELTKEQVELEDLLELQKAPEQRIDADLLHGESGAHKHLQLGKASHDVGNYKDALTHYQKGLSLAQTSYSIEVRIELLTLLGNSLRNLGTLQEAVDRLQEAIAMAQKHGLRRSEGRAQRGLGETLRHQGFTQLAIRTLEDARSCCEEAKDSFGVCLALSSQGFAFYDVERLEEAELVHEQALEIATELGNPREEAYALLGLGNVFIKRGRLINFDEPTLEGKRLLKKSLQIFDRIGEKRGQGLVLHFLGHVERNLGKPKAALTLYAQSLKLLDQVGAKRAIAYTHFARANMHRSKKGKQEIVVGDYSSLAKAFSEIGDFRGQSFVYIKLGLTLRDLGRLHEAKKAYQHALRIRALRSNTHVYPGLQDGDNLRGTAYANEGLAVVNFYLGSPTDLRKSQEHFELAEGGFVAVGDERGRGHVFNGLAHIEGRNQRIDVARTKFKSAVGIFGRTDDLRGIATAQYGLGVTYCNDKRTLNSAIKCFRDSEQAFKQRNNLRGQGYALHGLGNAYYLRNKPGDSERARKRIDQALAIFKEVEDKRGEGYAHLSMAKMFKNENQVKSDKEYELAKNLFTGIGDKYGKKLAQNQKNEFPWLLP